MAHAAPRPGAAAVIGVGLRVLRSRGGSAIAVVVILVVAGWWLHQSGYQQGYQAHQAETAVAARALNQRLARSQDALRTATAAYQRERREAEDLERRLSDDARDDPDADRRAPSADSVRRIDRSR